jgi:putative transcriptional regulator
MKQDQLGRLLGLSRQTICEIETGKRMPSLKVAYKIAKLLNTSIENVFFPEKKSN